MNKSYLGILEYLLPVFEHPNMACAAPLHTKLGAGQSTRTWEKRKKNRSFGVLGWPFSYRVYLAPQAFPQNSRSFLRRKDPLNAPAQFSGWVVQGSQIFPRINLAFLGGWVRAQVIDHTPHAATTCRSLQQQLRDIAPFGGLRDAPQFPVQFQSERRKSRRLM